MSKNENNTELKETTFTPKPSPLTDIILKDTPVINESDQLNNLPPILDSNWTFIVGAKSSERFIAQNKHVLLIGEYEEVYEGEKKIKRKTVNVVFLDGKDLGKLPGLSGVF